MRGTVPQAARHSLLDLGAPGSAPCFRGRPLRGVDPAALAVTGWCIAPKDLSSDRASRALALAGRLIRRAGRGDRRLRRAGVAPSGFARVEWCPSSAQVLQEVLGAGLPTMVRLRRRHDAADGAFGLHCRQATVSRHAGGALELANENGWRSRGGCPEISRHASNHPQPGKGDAGKPARPGHTGCGKPARLGGHGATGRRQARR